MTFSAIKMFKTAKRTKQLKIMHGVTHTFNKIQYYCTVYYLLF